MAFGMALMQYAQSEPTAAKVLPFVLGKTLGPVLGSYNLAALWGLLQTAPKAFRASAARAGFDPGLGMGEQLFRALLDTPQGMWIGKSDADNLFGELRTEDKKINLFIPELADWVQSITPASEEEDLKPDPEYPLILTAGRRTDYNANTVMRNPEWTKGKRVCTVLINPADADALSLTEGETVRVISEAGEEQVELEVTDAARPGHVVIPHGFGLVFQGKTFKANVNRLTKNTHRDRFAGTPYHRYIPCRVERV